MEIGAAPPPFRPRPRPYVLPLLESRHESPTVMTFRFSTAGSGFEYRSQQAIRLSLPDVPDPWGAARLFSLSSSPTERGILAVTCRISDTPFKVALSKLRPGETAHVHGPLGEFLLDTDRPSVFLAGGIGVTPFRGMLRYAADAGLTQSMVLLYSARSPEDLVFRRELDEIAGAHPNLSVQYTITRSVPPGSWSGRSGRIDAKLIEENVRGIARPRFYVAGLPEMVSEMVALLSRRPGVGPEDIDYEVFRGF